MPPELVTVYETQGMLTAELVKSKLAAAGIPALLKYESAGVVFGLTVDGLGRVQVQVPADLQEDALALLDETPGEAPDEADAPAG